MNTHGSARILPLRRHAQVTVEREYQSQTNVLEALPFTHRAKHGVEDDAGKLPSPVKQGKRT